MDYAKRYADLAREMAAKETIPGARRNSKRIAEVCAQVPANPAGTGGKQCSASG